MKYLKKNQIFVFLAIWAMVSITVVLFGVLEAARCRGWI